MPRSRADNEAIRERRRSELLAAASDLFDRHGLARTTVQDVADAAGVSAGLLYRYFRSREDLVRAALRPALERPLRQFVDEKPNDATLAELSISLLRDVAHHPQLYRLFFASFLQPEVRSEVDALRAELSPRQRALEATLVRRFRERGAQDPEAAARELRAALNGLALAIARGDPIDPAGAVERLLNGGASAAAVPGAPRPAPAAPARPSAAPEMGPPRATDRAQVVELYAALGVPGEPPPAASVTAEAGYRVRREGERLLAYARVDEHEGFVRVRELVTAREARRQGHARALLRAIAAEAARDGAERWGLYVKADNAAALALYRSLGLREREREIAIDLPDPELPLLPKSRGQVTEVTEGAALGPEAADWIARFAPRDEERVRVVENAYGGVDALAVGDDRFRAIGARTRGALATLLREGRPRVVRVPETSREARWLLEGGGRELFRLVALEGELAMFRGSQK